MSNVTRPVPTEQQRAFGLALCEYLGLDPATVGENVQWETGVTDDLSKVNLEFFVPTDDLLTMFNAGQVPRT